MDRWWKKEENRIKMRDMAASTCASGQRRDPTEPMQIKLLIKKNNKEEGRKDGTHRHINKNDPKVLARRARFCIRQQKHLMTSSRAGTCDKSFKEVGKGRKV